MPLQVPQPYIGDWTGQKGKAIRQDLALKEKQEELLGLKIEAFKNPQEDPKEKRDQEKWDAEQEETIQEAIIEAGAASMVRLQQPDVTPENSAQLRTEAFQGTLTQLLGEETVAVMMPTWDVNEDGIMDDDRYAELQSRVTAKMEGIAGEEGQARSARYKQAVDGGLTPGTPEFNSYVLNEGGDAGRQRDDEIRDAEKIFAADGHPDPHRAAVEFVDDGKIVLMSPTDNTVYEYDKFSGELTVKKPEDTRGPMPEVPYEETLYALADEVAGFGPGAKSALSKGLAPFNLYVAETTETAKSVFKAAENSLIEAFRLNPRYPQAEVKRIQDNIDIKAKVWDNPTALRARMAGSRKFLEGKLEEVEWNLQNPTITAKKRGEEENTRNGIRRYLSVLGKAPDTEEMEATQARIDEINARLKEIRGED